MALPSSLDLHLKHLRAVPPRSRGPSRCSPSCQPSSRPPHTCQTSPRAHGSSRAARCRRNALAFPNVLTEKLHRRRTAYRRLGGKPTPSQNCRRCQETPGRAPNTSSPSPTAWRGARVVLVPSLPLTSQPLCQQLPEDQPEQEKRKTLSFFGVIQSHSQSVISVRSWELHQFQRSQ